jgi:hypothetical protein
VDVEPARDHIRPPRTPRWHPWLLVLRDLRRHVQRDRFPYGHDLLLGQAVPLEEGASGVGPVDLEALVRGSVALEQANVVEHRPEKEQLGVVAPAQLFGPQGGSEKHSP